MKTLIYLIMTLCYTTNLYAQSNLYQESKQIQGDGYTYQCEVRSGVLVSLYNTDHQFINTEQVNRNTGVHHSSKDAYTPHFNSDNWTRPKCYFWGQERDLNITFKYDKKEKVITVYLENTSQSDIVLSQYTEINENGSSLRISTESDKKSFYAIPLMLFENGMPSQRLHIKAGTKRYCKFPPLKSTEYKEDQKLYLTLHLVYYVASQQPKLERLDIEYNITY